MNSSRIGMFITSASLLGALSTSSIGNCSENKKQIDKTSDSISVEEVIENVSYKYGLTSEELKDLKIYIESKKTSSIIKGASSVLIVLIFSYLIYLRMGNKKEAIKIKILLEDNKINENPVVIYKGSEPIDWNPAMEKLTGYKFEEILEKYEAGEDIIKLLYDWSDEELNRVKSALGKGKRYENTVFILASKEGKKHQIAWHTRFIEIDGEIYTIRSGSKDVYNILSSLDQSYSALTESITDLMGHKDVYTSGHINRVMGISKSIGKQLGYGEFEESQLRIKAILHDYGKRDTPDDILKKPGALTEEERIMINSHTGNGVFKAIKNGYEQYTDGMAHHCNFFSSFGDKNLTFKGLVKKIKAGVEIQATDFNKLLGRNIPDAGRIIAIGDVIDAICSRRIYSQKAGDSIEELIDFISKDLLKSSGLKNDSGNIILDEDSWIEAKDNEINLCYSIEFNGKIYIPSGKNKIQFDPLMLLRIYEDGKITKEIQDIIKDNDASIIVDKILEFKEGIEKLKEKKRSFNEMINKFIPEASIFGEKDEEIFNNLESKKSSSGLSIEEDEEYNRLLWKKGEYQKLLKENSQSEFMFSTEDEKNLERMEKILIKLKQIKKDYGI